MNIHELLEQIDFGTTDPTERAKRVASALHALAHGAEVQGVIGDKVTTVGAGTDGAYVVTQVWTIPGEVQS